MSEELLKQIAEKDKIIEEQLKIINSLKEKLFEKKKDLLLQENASYIFALVKGLSPKETLEAMELYCKNHYFERFPEDRNDEMIKNHFALFKNKNRIEQQDIDLNTLRCPYCGGEIEDFSYEDAFNTSESPKWRCKDCKFKMFKYVRGVSFTLEDLKELIETGSTRICVFKSKDRGEYFKARMMLLSNKPKVVFDYIRSENDLDKPAFSMDVFRNINKTEEIKIEE